jgi:anti-sigma factor RsiW
MNETHPSIEQIVDYLHGELSVADDAAIHAHLASCQSCEERRSDEAEVTDTLRAHARAQERELPPGVVARIRGAIERPVPVWERLHAAFRPVVAVPAAVALAVILYLGFGPRHRAVATPVDAAYYVNDHAALSDVTPFAQDASLPDVLTSNDDATR